MPRADMTPARMDSLREQMDEKYASERQLQIANMRLSEDAIKGLVPIQIQQMKETAVSVNESYTTAGRAIKSVCAELLQLKKNLKHGNWTAFLKSGALIISEKAASDLVSAYEKWLYDTEIPDSILGTMTPRAMAALGNSKPETRKIVLGKLLSGAKPSESEVRKLIREIEPRKSSKSMEEALAASGAKVVAKKRTPSIAAMVALEEENARLKKENEELKKKLAAYA